MEHIPIGSKVTVCNSDCYRVVCPSCGQVHFQAVDMFDYLDKHGNACARCKFPLSIGYLDERKMLSEWLLTEKPCTMPELADM